MKWDFKVGDVVFLKSDGPAATIYEMGRSGAKDHPFLNILKDGFARICWFNESKLEYAELPVECLIPESEVFCEDPACVHCYPSPNCSRDDCPHCSRDDGEERPNYLTPDPENN